MRLLPLPPSQSLQSYPCVSTQDCPAQQPERGILQAGHCFQLALPDTLLTILIPQTHVPSQTSVRPRPCIPMTSLRRPPMMQAGMSWAVSSCPELFCPASSSCGTEHSPPHSNRRYPLPLSKWQATPHNPT